VSTTSQAEAIRREMARIRCDLNEEVGGIVENARVMSDWRYYVRTYPLVCAVGAIALGYLVVPARLEVITPDAKTLAKLAEKNRLLVKPEPEPHKRGGIVGTLFTLLASTLVRGVVAYLGQVAGQALSDKAVEEGVGPVEPPQRW
jgi:hypothetical protein